MPELTKPVSLSDLIYWVKQELISDEVKKKDPIPLFTIDEITVEVNFVVDTKVKAGVSFLKVVDFGSEVGGKAVQKATVKMRPIINRDQLIEELPPDEKENIERNTRKVIFKGNTEKKEIIPPR